MLYAYELLLLNTYALLHQYSLIQDTDLQAFTFTDFGKNFPKSIKMSPEAFIQNAIQLAQYKLVFTRN